MSSTSFQKHKHKHKRTNSSLNITNTNPTTPTRIPNLDSLPQDYFTHHDQDASQDSPSSSPFPLHISPTKAAASARLDHDLTTLTTWLESVFHPTPPSAPLPPHLLKWRDEVQSSSTSSHAGTLAPSAPPSALSSVLTSASNSTSNSNAILSALKTIKQTNLTATHLLTLLHDASQSELSHLEALDSLSQRQRDSHIQSRTLLDAVHASLSPEAQDALSSLSRSAETLGLQFEPTDSNGNADADGSNADNLHDLFASRVLGQTHRELVVQEQRRELEVLQRVIDGRMEQDVRNGLGAVVGGSIVSDEEAEHIRAQTAQFNRDTKQINLKIMEYEERVKSLERQLAGLRDSSTSMQEVLEARKRVEERKATVAALQQRVAAFHGLPPDLDASRDEIRRAMNELEAMKRKRGELFEKIGNG